MLDFYFGWIYNFINEMKMKLFQGDKIKFKYYSNIDPYPICIGEVEHVYGPSFLESLYDKYEIDVKIIDVLDNHWNKDELIGRKIRIRNDFDIEKI